MEFPAFFSVLIKGLFTLSAIAGFILSIMNLLRSDLVWTGTWLFSVLALFFLFLMIIGTLIIVKQEFMSRIWSELIEIIRYPFEDDFRIYCKEELDMSTQFGRTFDLCRQAVEQIDANVFQTVDRESGIIIARVTPKEFDEPSEVTITVKEIDSEKTHVRISSVIPKDEVWRSKSGIGSNAYCISQVIWFLKKNERKTDGKTVKSQ